MMMREALRLALHDGDVKPCDSDGMTVTEILSQVNNKKTEEKAIESYLKLDDSILQKVNPRIEALPICSKTRSFVR